MTPSPGAVSLAEQIAWVEHKRDMLQHYVSSGRSIPLDPHDLACAEAVLARLRAEQEPPLPTIPVQVDPWMPPGMIEMRAPDGRVLATLWGVSGDAGVGRRIPPPQENS